ncbi:hypothetical protein RL73_05110 [Liberibacter crescens]|nr:hypothetical protein RL73_05110 [Liberibacter crescens]
MMWPIIYHLKPKPELPGLSVYSFRIKNFQDTFTIYLPLEKFSKGYLLFTSSLSQKDFVSEEITISRVNILASFIFWLQALFIFKENHKLYFKNFYIVAYGSKRKKKLFVESNHFMHKNHLNIKVIQKIPELMKGWNNNAIKITFDFKIAIVVHIYYVDLWTEIANLLSGLNLNFDLFITTIDKNLKEEILCRFPHSYVHIIENIGRDVRPFLILLENGYLDNYKYICKIHGKKSKGRGRYWLEGDIWRRWILFDLLGAPNSALKIIETFEKNDKIGMIGSHTYRYPNEYFNDQQSWGKNRPLVCSLIQKMGMDPEEYKLDFFAGTMFWVRRDALEPIKNLYLSHSFPIQNNHIDGTLAHAIERIFPASVIKKGLILKDVHHFP